MKGMWSSDNTLKLPFIGAAVGLNMKQKSKPTKKYILLRQVRIYKPDTAARIKCLVRTKAHEMLKRHDRA